MFRWVLLGLLCLGSASGGFISFRLGHAAATRDLASRPPPGTKADTGAEKAMEVGGDLRGPTALLPEDFTAAREELRLIEEANAAVTRGDFAAALSPLIEHERRFQRGWLSRERESLSVKAIDGLLISEPAIGPAPDAAASAARQTTSRDQRRS